MSAILELFNDNRSSQKILSEIQHDANIGVKSSNTNFTNNNEIEDNEEERLPFEELLTQHTSPSTKKTEGENTKKSVENLSKTTTETLPEDEETEGNVIYTQTINADNIVDIITDVLSGNAKPAELEKLRDFYNIFTSESTTFSNADKKKILDALKNLLHSLQSTKRCDMSPDNSLSDVSIIDPISSEGSKTGIAGKNPFHNAVLASKTSGEENKELFDTLDLLHKTTSSKNNRVTLQSSELSENKGISSFTKEGIDLQPGTFSKNKDFSSFIKEGFTLQSNVLSENKEFSSSLNKSFATRSSFLESFISNTNTQGLATSENSSITNVPLTSASTDESVVLQLNGLLNNYNDDAALLELSLPNPETREAHKALKSLLQTIINREKENVFAFTTSIDFNNSMFTPTGSTINRGTKDSGIQETVLQNVTEKNNGFIKNITNDIVNSTEKNDNKDVVSKEPTGSFLHNASDSFQEKENNNSYGNLSQQGKNTFTAANINNQPEKALVNNIPFNNPDFPQNMTESLNGATTNILSNAGNQKTIASPLFQGDTASGLNTLQNNVMEQILENIKTLHHGNKSEIKLQLTPPELGTVKLYFTEENDEVSARIYVENAEVKAAIQNNVHRLRESVTTNGLEIHKLEVYVQNENRNEHEQQRSFTDFEANDSHYQHSTRDNNESHDNESNEINHTRLLTKNKTVKSSHLRIDYIL